MIRIKLLNNLREELKNYFRSMDDEYLNDAIIEFYTHKGGEQALKDLISFMRYCEYEKLSRTFLRREVHFDMANRKNPGVKRRTANYEELLKSYFAGELEKPERNVHEIKNARTVDV